MKVKIGIICTVALLTAFLFGCTVASVNLTCDDFMSQNNITRELSVRTGDSFTVTLCSNPTTGFQWESAVISDQSVLTETGHQFVSPEDENLVGAAGKDGLTFQALKKGTSTISIAYSRPWEGGEKGVWTFTAVVTVK
ncbi:protease inhibitor I42 family protein [Chloroflexota bacterium]